MKPWVLIGACMSCVSSICMVARIKCSRRGLGRHVYRHACVKKSVRADECVQNCPGRHPSLTHPLLGLALAGVDMYAGTCIDDTYGLVPAYGPPSSVPSVHE